MRCIWSIMCSGAITSKETNNISLLEIVEEIHVEARPEVDVDGIDKAPLTVPCQWVSLITRDEMDKPEKKKVRDRVVSPEGKNILSREIVIDLMNLKRIRLKRRINAIPFSGPGEYLFCTDCEGDEPGEWIESAYVPIDIQLISSKVKAEE